jgi:2-dehydropantoate 2-reductase
VRIAIAGAGGVGGLLEALLSRSGTQVAVLARGAQADAIRAQGGIRLDSPLGTLTAPVAAVSDAPAALGPADAVLVAVKAWQVAELAPRLAPLLAAGGVAVPLQNGVEAAGLPPRRSGTSGWRAASCPSSWIEGPGR